MFVSEEVSVFPSFALLEDALFLCPLSPATSTPERPPSGEALIVGVLGERGLKYAARRKNND
jgi:hypothetical protein